MIITRRDDEVAQKEEAHETGAPRERISRVTRLTKRRRRPVRRKLTRDDRRQTPYPVTSHTPHRQLNPSIRSRAMRTNRAKIMQILHNHEHTGGNRRDRNFMAAITASSWPRTQ